MTGEAHDDPRAKSSTLVTLLDTAIILERALERRMRQIGLSVAQQRLITFLYIAQEPLTPSLLGALLLQKAHSVTSLVAGLEHKGLAVRRYDPHDRRIVFVELTEKGRKAAEEAIAAELELFARFEDILARPYSSTAAEFLRDVRSVALTLADFPEARRKEALRRLRMLTRTEAASTSLEN